MTYYHYTTIILSPGSRIAPGNWGRILRTYDLHSIGSPVLLASEILLEKKRLELYSDLPSRLNCNFVFDNQLIAQQQRKHFGVLHILYEVRIVTGESKTHRGGFNLLNGRLPTQGSSFIDHSEELAQRYWGGADIVVPEVLTTSEIEIVRRVD